MDTIILDLGSTIKGDSQVAGFIDKIEVMSYSHNVAMKVSNDVSLSERTAGQPHIGEFTLTKFIDSSTPSINQYCCSGKPIPVATVTVGHTPAEGSGQLVPLIVYTLNDVIISSISVSGGAGGKPVETLSLNFTKIKWALTAQKDDGTEGSTAASSWDLNADKMTKD